MGIPARRGFGRAETLKEKMFRLRGVIALVSVPVLLMGAIFILMPRGAPIWGGEGGSVGESRYAIVIDAGSTGSRVHAFHFSESHGAGLELISDTFEQLKPGLSSYAGKPAEGAASLQPLLDKALSVVPAELRHSTPIEVRATAGLRMLPGAEAEDLLAAVRDLLATLPFKSSAGSVSIMDGADEGAFMWMTTNYLLGNIGHDLSRTVAAIDLGGGSVQLAHAIPPARAAAAPEGAVRSMRGGGEAYSVYVHSYLGYGLMAARAALLGKLAGQHPCLLAGASTTYAYGGKSYTASGTAEGAALPACSAAAASALNADKPCAPAPAAECGFDGAWGGGGGAGVRSVYISSYFFDRAVGTGVVAKDAISGVTTAGVFGKMAEEACALAPADVAGKYPLVNEADSAYLCMDLAYADTLLTKGFKIPASQQVTLVKQIMYKGTPIEAAWPLGAAINSLSAAAPAAETS